MIKKLFLIFCYIFIALPTNAQSQSLKSFEFNGKQISLTDFLTNHAQIIEKDNRKLVAIPLRPLLALYLHLSSSIKSASLEHQIAESKLKEAKKPKLSWVTSYTISDTNRPNTVDATSSSFTATTNSGVTTGFNHKTLSGIAYELSLSSINTENVSKRFLLDPANQTSAPLQKFNQLALNFNFNFPIGKSFGKVNGINIIQASIASAQSKKNILDAIYQQTELVSDFYWNLVAIYAAIDIANNRVAESRTIVADNQVRAELGLISETFLLRSQNQLERDLNQRELLYLSLFELEKALKITLDIRDLDYGLYPSDKPQNSKLEHNDIATYLDKVINCSSLEEITCHPDFLGLKILAGFNQIDKITADDESRPDIDLGLQFSLKGYGEDFSAANSSLSSQNLNDYSLSLSWNSPLGSSKAETKKQQYLLEQMKLLTQEGSLKDNYELRIATQLKRIDFIQKQIDTATRSITIFRKLYEQEQYKYRLATSTRLEILEAQTELYNALANKANLLVEYEKNFYSFKLIVGDLFNYLKIDLNNIDPLEMLREITLLKK